MGVRTLLSAGIKTLSTLSFIALLSVFVVTAQNSKPKLTEIEAIPPAPPKEEKRRKFKVPKMSVKERLRGYFYGREIRPAIIINNLYDGVRDEREETIDISTHKVVWFHSFKETRIKINGDLFSLENQKTLNFVRDNDKEEVDFVNQWNQIKLFKFDDRELIGISMYNDPCTGIGCRVKMYLIYDLKTKTKNFFGTYRFLLDREFGLFDFGNDGSLDFLSGTYNDGNDGKGIEFKNIYEIYTMDDTGIFRLQLDQKGKPYFMKRIYKEENYEEINKKFEHNWIEEIK
jgi:hypothetical protein